MAMHAVGTRTSDNQPINLHNRKPFRTISQKKVAQDHAFKSEDGAYRTNAPFTIHSEPK
ncbi:MAG: hypothetical protein P4L79_10100 [Legionella sp.]|uniref:hypothetical protein n=1 Tax=Legionella sp. TaxID=459 RepID=UPI00284250BD|nr:hypothetical protein [Legionella sp.]